MDYSNVVEPMYYQEDYNYSTFFENEFNHNQNPSSFRHTRINSRDKNALLHSTVNYLDERKCPIYVHNIEYDSSVLNNYNQSFDTPRKKLRPKTVPKPTPQNSSKFVLDKLEETYWATWKPKKGNDQKGMKIQVKVSPKFNYTDSRTTFHENAKVKLTKKDSNNKPHGDSKDNVIKYFRAKNFDSSTDSVTPRPNHKKFNHVVPEKKNFSETDSSKITAIAETEKKSKFLNRPSNSRRIRPIKPKTQEIQTEVHCPVILEESKSDDTKRDLGNREENPENEGDNKTKGEEEDPERSANEKVINVEDLNETSAVDDKVTNEGDKVAKSPRKTKKTHKEGKQTKNKKPIKKEDASEDKESVDISEAISKYTFVEHKDSIEITKKKQEKEGPKEHFQQPKCIKLYRKSGSTASYIKGGSYPLKSILRKEGSPKGNFRLGAPGSPLFVTTSSFAGKRRK